ncbi:MAG: MATE family efflux transporter [Bacillota bacterium]
MEAAPSAHPRNQAGDIHVSELPMETGAIRAKVMSLAGPALVEMSLMTLVMMVDMMMVGRLGPWAITSVGLSNQPMFFAMAMFMALNVGTTALVARFVGGKEMDRASDAARQSLLLTVGLGLLLSLVLFVSAAGILRLMGARPEVLAPGTSYFRIASVGLFFSAINMSMAAVLRGAGDMKTPMRVNVVANIINVAGNALLIHGLLGFPRWEVAGAAVATAVSRLVACLMTLAVVYSGRFVIKLSPGDRYRLDREIVGRIFRVGIPAAVEQFVMRGGQMIFARIVASLGTTIYAAHQIALNVESLSFMPGFAFAMACTTLVGQSLGAGRADLAERCARETRRFGLLIMSTMGLMFFFFGRQVIMLYTSDAQVLQEGAQVLRIIALVQPALASNFILAGALRGAGDTRWVLYATFTGIWGIRIGLAYVLAIVVGWGLMGAWVAMALDMCVRALLVYGRFRSGRWKEIGV